MIHIPRLMVSTQIRILFTIAITVLLGYWQTDIYAQDANIRLDLNIDQRFSQADVINLTDIGLNGRTTSQVFNLILLNESTERQNNLFLNIEIMGSKSGLILKMNQSDRHPFSLLPGQRISASNTQLIDGIPGVAESVKFDIELTPEGEALLNNLKGGTRLPEDIYEINISLYQNGNKGNGNFISQTVDYLGRNSVGENINLTLLNPGGVLGTDISINTTQPVFRWDGQQGAEYRLVMVRDEGQSPETLIQSALSTDPAQRGQSATLLDFEMVDVLINQQSNYNYPISGVQPLRAGEHYYWQVYTLISTSSGVEEQPSEIWEFNIADHGRVADQVLTSEAIALLRSIIGQNRFEQIDADGFSLVNIELDGQQYSGATLSVILEELILKEQSGEISIIGN
ncbi:MAG: hypothetical protein WD267_00870 [Balneolales bacterium]